MEGFSEHRRDASSDSQENPTAGEKGRDEQYRRQLLELRLSASGSTDPMQSVIRHSVAKLVEMADHLGEAIKVEFKARRPNVRTVRVMLPVINSFTLLHRQAYRYAQLDRDRSSSETGDDNRGNPMVLPEQTEKRDSVT